MQEILNETMCMDATELLNHRILTDEPVNYYAWYTNGYIQHLGQLIGRESQHARFSLNNTEFTFRLNTNANMLIRGFLAITVQSEFIKIHKNNEVICLKMTNYVNNSYALLRDGSMKHKETYEYDLDVYNMVGFIQIDRNYIYSATSEGITEIIRTFTPKLLIEPETEREIDETSVILQHLRLLENTNNNKISYKYCIPLDRDIHYMLISMHKLEMPRTQIFWYLWNKNGMLQLLGEHVENCRFKMDGVIYNITDLNITPRDILKKGCYGFIGISFNHDRSQEDRYIKLHGYYQNNAFVKQIKLQQINMNLNQNSRYYMLSYSGQMLYGGRITTPQENTVSTMFGEYMYSEFEHEYYGLIEFDFTEPFHMNEYWEVISSVGNRLTGLLIQVPSSIREIIPRQLSNVQPPIRAPTSMSTTKKQVTEIKIPQKIEMPELREGVEIPNEYLCPISHEIMLNPVICMDGQTYDHLYIKNWLDTKETSPHTNMPMETKLIPNYAMKNIIQKWCNENKA